jgi:hypothetical protein
VLFLARAFSVLLHPLLMPLLTIWLALSVDPQLGYFALASTPRLVGDLRGPFGHSTFALQ